jgi:hypothetical protein
VLAGFGGTDVALVGLMLYRRPRAARAVVPEPELADVGITAAETSPAASGLAPD